MGVRLPRQCCRPGCARAAVATLTFVYAESTAVVGPLATTDEPHSWDLCDDHARRITVPRGWEMLRSESGFSAPVSDDYELTALAEAVREASGGRPAASNRVGAHRRDDALAFDTVDDDLPRPRAPRPADATPRGPIADDAYRRAAAASRPRSARRGHLRVLPDPVD